MSEIRIIYQQVQKTLSNPDVKSQMSQQLIDNLRIGQTLKAQLISKDNKYWLLVDSVKLLIPKETVEQWNLQVNQVIKLKVKSLTEPVELQIIKLKSQISMSVKPVEKLLQKVNDTQLQLDTTPKDKKETTVSNRQISSPSITNQVDNRVNNKVNNRVNVTADILKTAAILPRSTQGERFAVDQLIIEVKTSINKEISDSSTIIIAADSKAPLSKDNTHKVSELINSSSERKATSSINNKNSPAPSTEIIKPTITANSNNKDTQNQTANTNTPATENKISQVMQSLITASRGAIVQQTAKPIQAESQPPTTVTLSHKIIQASINPIKAEQQPFTMTSQPTKSELLTNSHELQASKQTQLGIKTELQSAIRATPDLPPQLSTKHASQPLLTGEKKATVTPATVINNSTTKLEQSTVTTKTITPELTNTSKQDSPVDNKRMKFEIPVTLPDQEKFPLLSEKIIAAFNRHSQLQQPTGKSINQLFSQLQRLNQWNVENKAFRRSETGAQAEKLVSDLKGALKDLFRYINNKNNLQSPKSIEKALRQSGTFLEKRIKTNEQVQKQATGSSSELTIHKDLKANLNRVLAIALYNLAKINSAKTPPSDQGTNSTKQPTAPPNDQKKTSHSQKQLLDISSGLKNNLLMNIRAQLMKFTTGKVPTTNLLGLEAITKEVLKNVQSAISRTQLNQLANLRPETSLPQWLFELPVMNNKQYDIFSLYLKQQESEEELTKKSGWSLLLQFNIGDLGKIRAMLSWDGHKSQVRFIAEQSNTVNLVDAELSYFQNKLSDNGIVSEQLSVEQAQLDDLSIQFSKG